jgi:tetratricopeptide (TPR) repeat protein
MPKSRTRDLRARLCAAAAVRISFFLLASAAPLCGGCRAFRCQKVTDESIAAARQLSLQGLDAWQRGQWEKAQTLFASAVSKCPHDERAHYGYAQSLWQLGAHNEAIAQMEEAVRLSGHDPERLVQLGEMYCSRGDMDRARDAADRAIVANPQLAVAWALKGQVLHVQGRLDEALANYHRALSYQQALPGVQLAVADIYTRQNRPQRTLATLQALAATYPPNQVPPDLLVRESAALKALGRNQDAARTLAQAAGKRDPWATESISQHTAVAAAATTQPISR